MRFYSSGLRGRIARYALHALLVPVLLTLLLGPLPVTPPAPAQAAALGIRWGFYVTYNPNSLASLQAHADQLNYVSPWYYNVDANGTVTGSLQPVVNDLLKTKGIKNLPLLKNTPRYQDFHDVLFNPTKRTYLIQQLHNLVLRDGYDGITIDFEAVTDTDGPLLSAFMTFLYRDFKTIDKTVAMAIPPKTRDVSTGWAGAYNYRDLRDWADYFVIMAYDQHFASGDPGPVAPLPWLNDVATYVVNTLTAQKVIWGIGAYGYDWNTSFYPRPQATSPAWSDVQQLAATYHGTPAYDSVNQAPSLVYVKDNQRHEVWYENKQSFDAKINLVQQRGFPGFALWRLGQEDPGVWNSIAGLRSPCTPIAPFTSTGTRVYFPQTGHSLGGGFLQYWRAHGGLAIYGYPLTEEFVEVSPSDGKSYTVQYFQRNRFEWHPELAGTPYSIQLGLLGAQYIAGRMFVLSPPFPSTPTRVYFAETQHSLGGGFLQYWRAHGGLAQFGYPLSEEFSEQSPTDGKTYTVQYFERARFEWHPEYRGTANEFQLGLLGVWAGQQGVCLP